MLPCSPINGQKSPRVRLYGKPEAIQVPYKKKRVYSFFQKNYVLRDILGYKSNETKPDNYHYYKTFCARNALSKNASTTDDKDGIRTHACRAH